MTTPAMQMAFGWKDRETAEKYIQIAAATKEQVSNRGKVSLASVFHREK